MASKHWSVLQLIILNYLSFFLALLEQRIVLVLGVEPKQTTIEHEALIPSTSLEIPTIKAQRVRFRSI